MTTDKNVCGTSLFETGDVIDGKWVLIERIGEGGMGVVYRAHQLNLKRDVAIKVISGEMLSNLEENPDEIATAMERFQREVQTMAQVRHANVLQIYDYGSTTLKKEGKTQQVEYIAMEYVPGNTFRYTMSEQGFDDETGMLADWLREALLPVLDGMEAIHDHGVVHRDMKPENILMDGDVPKIADFGLARSLKLRCVSNSWDVKGTWPYMAPEQFAEFRKAGIPADIYALGKILYEAVTGKLDKSTPPFKPVALDDPSTPLLEAVDRIIRKATSETPDERYQNIPEFRRDVSAALETAAEPGALQTPASTLSPAAVRWLWIGVAAAILSMAGMTVYHIWEGIGAKPPAVTVGPAVDNEATEPAPAETTVALTPTRLATDGREMRLLEDTEDGRMFYADMALVTFHHYLEFLNEVADEVSVADGVVQQGDSVLFYFEDKVVFRHNRFHLLDAKWAPKPVTRVTWRGANAYARHYGKRPPTFEDWSILRQRLPGAVEPPAPARPEPTAELDVSQMSSGMHMMDSGMPMMESSPSGNPPEERPESSDAVAKEWVGLAEEGEVSSRVVAWPGDDASPTLLRRYPWEGFLDVGFRTVMDVEGNLSKKGESG
jgi:serine/threonine-protein kinase